MALLKIASALAFATATVSAGVVPATAANACACSGAVANGVCYDDLATAIGKAPAGCEITIGGKHVLTESVTINRSLTLRGVACGTNTKAVLSANMDTKTGGMLEARGPGPLAISFKNIKFTREHGSGLAAGFRGGVVCAEDKSADDYSDVEAPEIDLNIVGCDFDGLATKARGGSAIYITRPKSLKIDATTTIRNNVNENNGEQWGGGGALWLLEVAEESNIQIDGTWENNVGKFEHSLGGAIEVDSLFGKMQVQGTFRGNKASDGGAIHIYQLEKGGHLEIHPRTVFDSNEAIEYGWGSRAGVIRLQNIYGTAVVDGKFTNNKSGGRGGILATNNFRNSKAAVTIRGTYTGNTAAGTGGIYDVSMKMVPGSTITVEGSCVFKNNVSEKGAATSLLNIKPLGKKVSESAWKGKTMVFRA